MITNLLRLEKGDGSYSNQARTEAADKQAFIVKR